MEGGKRFEGTVGREEVGVCAGLDAECRVRCTGIVRRMDRRSTE
jgi:hypothetical protein